MRHYIRIFLCLTMGIWISLAAVVADAHTVNYEVQQKGLAIIQQRTLQATLSMKYLRPEKSSPIRQDGLTRTALLRSCLTGRDSGR